MNLYCFHIKRLKYRSYAFGKDKYEVLEVFKKEIIRDYPEWLERLPKDLMKHIEEINR